MIYMYRQQSDRISKSSVFPFELGNPKNETLAAVPQEQEDIERQCC